MANTVQVVVNPPDRGCVKRGTEVPDSAIQYTAAFHLESASKKKPIHVGPTLYVHVVDSKGNILRTDACTIVVNDKGDGELEATLRRTKRVECSAERE